MRKERRILLVTFVMLSMLLTIIPPVVSTPPYTTVYLSPTTITVNPGETFIVKVEIFNVTNLFNWEVKVSWTPGLLNCLGRYEDPQWQWLIPGPWEFPPLINNEQGWLIDVKSVAPPGIHGYNGSGILAAYKFKALSNGVTFMNITDVLLIDTELYEIQCNIENALVGIGQEPYIDPKANFTYSPKFPYVDETVTFNASNSSPGWNGTHSIPIGFYVWDFGDDNAALSTSPTVAHEYASNGTYNVTLTVTDAKGHSNTTSKPINVVKSYGPMADFTWSPPYSTANFTVTFDASNSLPGWNGTHEQPIVSYEWNFGDEKTNITSNPIITHEYTLNGTYTVVLNVTDSQSLWNTTSKQITTHTPFHDVAIIGAEPSSDWAYPYWFGVPPGRIRTGFFFYVNVTNEGDFIETFEVTAYYDFPSTTKDVMGTKAVTDLAPGETANLTFIWDLTCLPVEYRSGTGYVSYTLSANITTDIPGEVDLSDNSIVDGSVKLILPGDTNRNGRIDIADVGPIVIMWGQYDRRYDFNRDGRLDIWDIGIIVMLWGVNIVDKGPTVICYV